MRLGPAHAAAVGLWSILAFSPAVVKSLPLPQARPIGPERLQIKLVAPREPARAPGGVLDVGEVEDGFDRASLIASRQNEVMLTPVVLDAWPEGEAAPEPVRIYRPGEPVEIIAPELPRVVLNAEDRTFGFGERLPDFAAERQARQALYDAPAALESRPETEVLTAPEALQ